jgi:transcriptional regulator with XRE-family HTH domain
MELNIPKIKREMELEGLTIGELSRRMGRSRTYAYSILYAKTNPRLKTVELLAKALHIDPKDLLI